MKFARKNIGKTKKTGYRGVLRKRYAKYTHMKDLYLKRERLRKAINLRKKIDSAESKLRQKIKQQKLMNKITQAKPKERSALSRFGIKMKENTYGRKFNSRWRNRPKKIYF